MSITLAGSPMCEQARTSVHRDAVDPHILEGIADPTQVAKALPARLDELVIRGRSTTVDEGRNRQAPSVLKDTHGEMWVLVFVPKGTHERGKEMGIVRRLELERNRHWG